MPVHQEDLHIPRGATWRAHAWVLLDDTTAQAPIRTALPTDTACAAKIRPHASSDRVLFEFTTTLVMLTLTDQYGTEPVLAVMLAQIPHSVTAGWDWDVGEWDVTVDHEVVLSGAVRAPMVVSR